MKRKLLLGAGAALFLGAACAVVPLANTKVAHGVELGTRKVFEKDGVKYYSSYSSYEDVHRDGLNVNVRINEEGFTLLKNDGDTLPLEGVKKISVFGKNSANPGTSGGGSGQTSMADYVSVYDSLRHAGLEVNPALEAFYEDESRSGVFGSVNQFFGGGVHQIGETPLDEYDETVKASFSKYNEAAFVFLKRSGTEGSDNPRRVPNRYKDEYTAEEQEEVNSHHYFELSKEESELIDYVSENFNRVVVIMNTASPLEIAELKANPKIGAIMWCGIPGANGWEALGRVVTGIANPSGKTVDTWVSDYRKDPTWNNFGNGDQTTSDWSSNFTMTDEEGRRINRNYDVEGNLDETGKAKALSNNNDYFVRYEEGVYVGYRYYETVGHDKGEEWYNEAVVYPYGYGLSYTDFEVSAKLVNQEAKIEANTEIAVDVTVKNVGKRKGKQTVELYFKAPYIDGEIEKPYEVLAAYDKTSMLEPGESEVLRITFHVQDFASYDYQDANGNDHKGYELDAGDYQISVNTSAHDVVDEFAFTAAETINYDTDRITGKAVGNLFTENWVDSLPTKAGMFTAMSRAKDNYMIQPDGPTAEESVIDETMIKQLVGVYTAAKVEKDENLVRTLYDMDDPRKISDELIAKFKNKEWYQQDESYYFKTADTELDENKTYYVQKQVQQGWSRVTVYEAVVNPVEEDIGKYYELHEAQREDLYKAYYEMAGLADDSEEWDKILNNLTWGEIVKLVREGGYKTTEVSWIGKGNEEDADGPAGFSRGVAWATEVNMAATFNDDLLFEMGQMVGEESLWLDISGWYGPACNMHRSYFGGRNFEYYSEDPFHSGMMAASAIAGAQTRGLRAYVKHFAVNDQETERMGISTFVSEQALREIYLKPFEYAIKVGQSKGVMASFNRIGLTDAFGNWASLTGVLRNEWGFKGAVVSDYGPSGDVDGNTSPVRMFMSGMDFCLNGGPSAANLGTYNANTNEVLMPYTNENGQVEQVPAYSYWYAMRTAAKRILWESANSNGVNNGYNMAAYTIEANTTQGAAAAIDIDVSADFEAIGAKGGQYSATGLPEGLSINSNGHITGSVQETGRYNAQITLSIDGWVKQTRSIRINVIEPFSVVGEFQVGVETENAALTMNIADTPIGTSWQVVSQGWFGPSTTTYTVTGIVGLQLAPGQRLPAGLSLGEGGVITGTPTQAGIYNLTFNYVVNANDGRRTSQQTMFSRTVTLTVKDAEGNVPAAPAVDETAELRNEVNDLNGQLNDAEARLDSALEELAQAEAALIQAQNAAEKAGGDALSTRAALEEAIKNLEAAQEKANSADAEVKALREEYDAKVAELEKAVADLKALVEELSKNSGESKTDPATPANPSEETKKGGCGGSIIATSAILTTAALAFAGLAIAKKRKEDK